MRFGNRCREPDLWVTAGKINPGSLAAEPLRRRCGPQERFAEKPKLFTISGSRNQNFWRQQNRKNETDTWYLRNNRLLKNCATTRCPLFARQCLATAQFLGSVRKLFC